MAKKNNAAKELMKAIQDLQEKKLSKEFFQELELRVRKGEKLNKVLAEMLSEKGKKDKALRNVQDKLFDFMEGITFDLSKGNFFTKDKKRKIAAYNKACKELAKIEKSR
ncbi:MAG: hypothetical protein AAB432_00865 [Patescibacteria group bacterium]